MTEWTEAVWIGVSAIIAAMVLTLVVTLGSVSRDMARVQQDQIDAVEVLKEYRKYNMYDGTKVYSQDIASLIIQTKGFPAVRVDTLAGAGESFTLNWNTSILPDSIYYTADWLQSHIPLNATYSSTIEKDPNGAITRFTFRRD